MQLLKFTFIFTFAVILFFASPIWCSGKEEETTTEQSKIYAFNYLKGKPVEHKMTDQEQEAFQRMDEIRKRLGKVEYHYYTTINDRGSGFPRHEGHAIVPGLDDPLLRKILHKLLKDPAYTILSKSKEVKEELQKTEGKGTPEEFAVKWKLYKTEPTFFKEYKEASKSQDTLETAVRLCLVSLALLLLGAFTKGFAKVIGYIASGFARVFARDFDQDFARVIDFFRRDDAAL